MWIIVTVVAFLLNAISNVINKVLLSTRLPSVYAYAFYVSLLQILAVFLIPFGFTLPSLEVIYVSFFSGITFTIALLLFFIALKDEEPAKITTIIGGLQPVLVFVLAVLYVSESLSILEFIAFVLLISGTIVISHERTKSKKRRKRATVNVIIAIVSALFYAISFSSTKWVFNATEGFVTGFVLTRIGGVIGAILLLTLARTRKEVFTKKKVKTENKLLFLGNQVIGATSFTLVFFAISISSVTLVTAFNGVQYAFIFLLELLLFRKFPSLLKEKPKTQVILKKGFAIVLIIIGIAVLSFESVNLLS